jgi:WD repeat-containing protein 23
MQADGTSGGPATFSLSGISLHHLTRLLRAASGGGDSHLYAEENDGDGDDQESGVYEDEDDWEYERRSVGHPPWYEEVKEPVKEGVELLYSGDFGRVGHKCRSKQNTANLAKHVLSQASKAVPVASREDLSCVCF